MKRSSLNTRVLLTALAVIVATQLTQPLMLFAQTNVGRIVGVVNDPTQALVPNASVAAKAIATGVERETTTNSQGAYAIPLLPIGEYVVTVSAPGFKTLDRPGVRIVSGETTTLDFTLELGQVAETIEVVAAVPTVDTATATTGLTRVTEELAELPVLILGRNRTVWSLIRTFPGVSPLTSNTDDATFSQGISLTSVNGAPEGGALHNVDGVYGSQSGNGGLRDDFAPPPEMIAEMRLSATNAPEFGWNSGVQVTLVTKSGSNDFHGSLFHYFRNDKLDSRNFLASQRSPNKQNEYGFVIGGPVIKDKTFFIGMYSGFKFRTTPGGRTLTVPTPVMRGGDFSEWLADTPSRVIYDPSTSRTVTDAQGFPTIIKDPFPGNVIPNSRFSPVSLAFQGGFPPPTRPGTQDNWVGSLDPGSGDTDKVWVKIDHNFTQRHKVNFSWDRKWRDHVTGGFWSGSPITSTWFFTNNSYRYRLGYNWVIAPNIVFGSRVGLTWFANTIVPPPQTATFAREAGLTGTQLPITPRVGITQLAGHAFGNQFSGSVGPNAQWIIPAYADLTWNVGTHNMKFGAAYLQSNFTNNICTGCAGNFSFSNFTTGLPGEANTGVGYASFLLGESSGGSVITDRVRTFTTHTTGFYWQDSWRVSSKLTLDYGIRWDTFYMIRERFKRLSVMDPTIPNPGAGGLLGANTFYGDGPGRNGLNAIGSPDHVFSPRFGLAYAVTPKMVFRASYGLSSNALFGLNQMGGHFPSTGWSWNGSTSSLDGGVTPAFNWTQGFPLAPPPLPTLDPAILNGGGNVTFFRDDVRAARTQNLNVGIEREFPGSLLVKASYVSTRSHALPAISMSQGNQLNEANVQLGGNLLLDINSAEAQEAGFTAPFPGFSGNVAQALLPFPQYQSITRLAESRGYSIYHAFQLTVQKRFGHGLSFLTSYTLSKQLGNVGSFQGQGVAINGTRSIQRNSEVNTKTLALLDRPQVLTLSYVYELPFGKGKQFANTASGIVDHLIGGWQVAGLHQYFSGDAVRVTTSQSIAGNFGGIWANRVPGVPIPATGCGNYDPNNPAQNRYMNVGAFSVPGPFTFGDTSVLPNIRNCGYSNENFSVQKVFRISERVNTLFSVDFLNLFNRHTWLGLRTNVSQENTFGKYTGATDPRVIQLHLKVEF